MTAKTVSLSLAALALLSTTAAYAQSVESQRAGLFELRVFGAGISIGDKSKVAQTGNSGTYMNQSGPRILVGNQLYTTQEFARIIPSKVSLGSAQPVHAKVEAPKPMFHLDLFGGRPLEFGPHIAPSRDMRID